MRINITELQKGERGFSLMIPLISQNWKELPHKLNGSVSGCVRFEVLAAVYMRNAVFWVVTPCGQYDNRRFRGTYLIHHQGERNQRARNNIKSNFLL
jgi:hypothetical protein